MRDPRLARERRRRSVVSPSDATTPASDQRPELLFTENDSNLERLYGTPNPSPYVKDAFHEYLINGRQEAVNPLEEGTKAAAHYRLMVDAGSSVVVRLRLTREGKGRPTRLFQGFDRAVEAQRAQADEFYATVIPGRLGADAAAVMRQALPACSGPSSGSISTFADGSKGTPPSRAVPGSEAGRERRLGASLQ